MHLRTRNVNTAFNELVETFHCGWHGAERVVVSRPSRNGNVFMINEPVTITYTHPRERVLFNAARDANPFFHLYEALWMLAGRRDVAPLAYYCSRMKDFSDDGTTLNGAYGYRWRHGISRDIGGFVDQLDVLVGHLKAEPTSRRAVLQMWNVESDLLKIGPKETTTDANQAWKTFDPPSKDVCCNLSVMFSLRDGPYNAPIGVPDNGCKFLDMTVTNRSNDLVWGLLGANYVHFTVLQEYMAARLGAEVGLYHHFSNNLHCYSWNWHPDLWLGDNTPDLYQKTITTVPLVKNPKVFEAELPRVVQNFSQPPYSNDRDRHWEEPFFEDVVRPMLISFDERKITGCGSKQTAVVADDWRFAADGWHNRRVNRGVKEGA